jgi:hypothetical protein
MSEDEFYDFLAGHDEFMVWPEIDELINELNARNLEAGGYGEDAFYVFIAEHDEFLDWVYE